MADLLSSLKLIAKAKAGNTDILHEHKWLSYLYRTDEKNVNLEQVESLESLEPNPVLHYVEKTLAILDRCYADLPASEKEIIEEVLRWSEVAKCGSAQKREEWRRRGFQLRIHNIGSARIYAHEQMAVPFGQRHLQKEDLIYTLILTHGLVGQFIRGEVRYRQLYPLIDWIQSHRSSLKWDIKRILLALNHCIIEGVSPAIWEKVRAETSQIISWIAAGEKSREHSLKERLRRLRESSIQKGEDFEALYTKWFSNRELASMFHLLFQKTDIWYVESALQDFSFEEFLKIFLLVYQKTNPLTVEQISFEPLMKDIYYDYKGKKSVNLYKKRIIEAYLKACPLAGLISGDTQPNEHVTLELIPFDSLGSTTGVNFTFSKPGEKLIAFCQEAEKSPLYERSILLLYDFFGFRKDAFDRLQNEQHYLADMNNAEDHKKIIADFAKGTAMIDVGAGGGIMLDLLSKKHPNADITGIDISTNIIQELERKKVRERKSWKVKQADALKLSSYFELESADTIIFSSILHEMYSYIPFHGRTYNPDVVKAALKSAFTVLKPGGRMIIRDGIMTEPKDLIRLLAFRDPDGFRFFTRYVEDFKGRKIDYEITEDNKIKLPVNDLMEFLYTYTWGEEAYPHEVQEQFGYFTPSEYRKVIEETLGSRANIICFRHYLQEGYSTHLLPKVKVMDESGKETALPDSTCFIVIEKAE
ncbi:class I SAM-dependent methyltransferase [Heyndrickxia faecalis]